MGVRPCDSRDLVTAALGAWAWSLMRSNRGPARAWAAHDAPKKAWRLRQLSRRATSAANWPNPFDAETAEFA
jgi:hypothetical protein